MRRPVRLRTAASTAPPAEISLGQTIDQVTAILGTPKTVVDLGNKKTYVYKDMKVVFIGGKVTDVQRIAMSTILHRLRSYRSRGVVFCVKCGQPVGPSASGGFQTGPTVVRPVAPPPPPPAAYSGGQGSGGLCYASKQGPGATGFVEWTFSESCTAFCRPAHGMGFMPD